MTLPDEVRHALEEAVGVVLAALPVGGGCIANASRVVTATGEYFLKWAPGPAGGTFAAEARGLRALAAAGTSLVIPDVILVADSDGTGAGYLLLTWVATGHPGSGYSRLLGEGLAQLHSSTEPQGRFGFNGDNFIGRLPQRNDWRVSWPEFFRDLRLQHQIEIARRTDRWRASWDRWTETLLNRLDDLLPATPQAALCHGDLWSGNALCAADGSPVLIDPAAYFGHAETDLAMMTLFGGFDRAVYEAYHRIHPPTPGFDDRQGIYQLYHLLSHLNHFGDGYAGAVGRVLERFE